MIHPGEYVAEHLSPVEEGGEQVQPNGVDLTVQSIHEQVGAGEIREGGKTVGNRKELSTDNKGFYTIGSGAYIVEYGEQIKIPDGSIGLVLPRSSLMRNSSMLHTAVWDSGYEGIGEGLLEVNKTIRVQQGSRIGQMIYADAENNEQYDGDYQGERL